MINSPIEQKLQFSVCKTTRRFAGPSLLSCGLKPSFTKICIRISFCKTSLLSPWVKIKKSEASFCRSALLLSFCENRFCLSRLLKKVNSTERGALFRHFCVSKVITTAHAHKSGVIFHFFKSFQTKKIKALRPKMTKIASRGSCLKPSFKCYKSFKTEL